MINGGQGLAFLVLQGNPRADARIARLDRSRIGIDDAVLVVQPANVVLVEVAVLVAHSRGRVHALDAHQQARRFGQVVLGVGRIVEVRRDGPAGLAVAARDLGHLEGLLDLLAGFIVLHDFQPRHVERILEVRETTRRAYLRPCASCGERAGTRRPPGRQSMPNQRTRRS